MMAVKKINKLLWATALVSSLGVFSVQAKDIDMNTAQMQAMDKITGRVSVINVPVNGDIKFGSFSIVVRACKTRPPEETPENFAFVDVVDSYNNEKPLNIFKGWMMSSTPGLNAVEHPIYDVWLLKCINDNVDKSKLLNAEQLKERDGLPKAPKITERDEYKKIEGLSVATPTIIKEDEPNEAILSPTQLNTEIPTQEVVTHPLDAIIGEAPTNVEPLATEPQLIPDEAVLLEDGAPKSLLNLGRQVDDAPKEIVPEMQTSQDNVIEEPEVPELDMSLSDDEIISEEPLVTDDNVSGMSTIETESDMLPIPEKNDDEQLIEFID